MTIHCSSPYKTRRASADITVQGLTQKKKRNNLSQSRQLSSRTHFRREWWESQCKSLPNKNKYIGEGAKTMVKNEFLSQSLFSSVKYKNTKRRNIFSFLTCFSQTLPLAITGDRILVFPDSGPGQYSDSHVLKNKSKIFRT